MKHSIANCIARCGYTDHEVGTRTIAIYFVMSSMHFTKGPRLQIHPDDDLQMIRMQRQMIRMQRLRTLRMKLRKPHHRDAIDLVIQTVKKSN
jgi:hypothetical protein